MQWYCSSLPYFFYLIKEMMNKCIELIATLTTVFHEVRTSVWHHFQPTDCWTFTINCLIVVFSPTLIIHLSLNDSCSFLPCLGGLFMCVNPPAIFASKDLNSLAVIMCSISVWSQWNGGFNENHGCTNRLYSEKEYFKAILLEMEM